MKTKIIYIITVLGVLTILLFWNYIKTNQITDNIENTEIIKVTENNQEIQSIEGSEKIEKTKDIDIKYIKYVDDIEGKIFTSNFKGMFVEKETQANIKNEYENAVIINSEGKLIYESPYDGRSIFDFKKHPNGMYSYFILTSEDTVNVEMNGEWVLLDENFKEIKRISAINYENTDCHDFQILKNGNYMLIIYNTQEVNGEKIVTGILQEQTPDGEVVFEWNSLDYIPVEDSNFNIDFSYPYYKNNNLVDYIHINSVIEDEDGNFIISSRHTNDVTKINKKTGEIIWRLGGKKSDFVFVDDPLGGFSHQHTATILENGNILIYDNGNLHETPQTRILEYKLDETNNTATLVWSYQEEGKFTYAMGSAQRLKNGNTLIGWGIDLDTLRITEIDKDKNKILDIHYPEYKYLYRAFKDM